MQTIHDIDFAQLYLNHKRLADRPRSTSLRWDQKSKNIEIGQLDTPYTRAFISEMQLEPTDTLLDVGCGVGTIAVMVAQKVQHVYALDYSQGMLDKLKANMDYYNTHNISILCKEWEEDWQQQVPQCDVVVASRSTLVEDMETALLKLHHHARRHVYLTYPAKNTFGTHPTVDVKKHPQFATPGYLYILNILHQHGIQAQLRFIGRSLTSEGQSDEANWALIDWHV